VLEKYMVSNTGFCNAFEGGKVTGFQVKVRLPYYRGVFLSMIEDFRVTVDGEFFGVDKIRFSYLDKTYTLKELNKASEVHWDFGQWATLIVSKPGGLAGGMHKVQVGVISRTSYELPKEMDPQGLFRQQGPGSNVQAPSIEDRYKFTLPSPGSGLATRTMTLVQ
jgi:hypothetical protein